MMKRILLVFTILLCATSLFAQYPDNSRKQRLGYQTTGAGLVYVGTGTPSHTPTTDQNTWMYLDTTGNVLYFYNESVNYWENLLDSSQWLGTKLPVNSVTIDADTNNLTINNLDTLTLQAPVVQGFDYNSWTNSDTAAITWFKFKFSTTSSPPYVGSDSIRIYDFHARVDGDTVVNKKTYPDFYVIKDRDDNGRRFIDYMNAFFADSTGVYLVDIDTSDIVYLSSDPTPIIDAELGYHIPGHSSGVSIIGIMQIDYVQTDMSPGGATTGIVGEQTNFVANNHRFFATNQPTMETDSIDILIWEGTGPLEMFGPSLSGRSIPRFTSIDSLVNNTNFAQDNLSFNGNRSHTAGVYDFLIESDAAFQIGDLDASGSSLSMTFDFGSNTWQIGDGTKRILAQGNNYMEIGEIGAIGGTNIGFDGASDEMVFFGDKFIFAPIEPSATLGDSSLMIFIGNDYGGNNVGTDFNFIEMQDLANSIGALISSPSLYTASGTVPTGVVAAITDSLIFGSNLLYLSSADGRVGINTVPDTSIFAIENIGVHSTTYPQLRAGGFSIQSAVAGNGFVTANGYFDSGQGGMIYYEDGPISMFQFAGGAVGIRTLPDGLAGGVASPNTRLIVSQDGNVGIGGGFDFGVDPDYLLDIGTGGFRIAGQSSAPTGAAGVMYYNSTNNEFYYHNGTEWRVFTGLNNDVSDNYYPFRDGNTLRNGNLTDGNSGLVMREDSGGEELVYVGKYAGQQRFTLNYGMVFGFGISNGGADGGNSTPNNYWSSGSTQMHLYIDQDYTAEYRIDEVTFGSGTDYGAYSVQAAQGIYSNDGQSIFNEPDTVKIQSTTQNNVLYMSAEGGFHNYLTLDGGTNAHSELTLDRGGTNRDASILFKTAGADTWEIGKTQSDNHFRIEDSSDDVLLFYDGAPNNSFVIDAAGDVGFSVADPLYQLDIASGGFRIGGQSAAPTGAAGVVYYDTDDNTYYGHDGTSFQPFATGGATQWTATGNRIYNNNTDAVLVGATTISTLYNGTGTHPNADPIPEPALYVEQTGTGTQWPLIVNSPGNTMRVLLAGENNVGFGISNQDTLRWSIASFDANGDSYFDFTFFNDDDRIARDGFFIDGKSKFAQFGGYNIRTPSAQLTVIDSLDSAIRAVVENPFDGVSSYAGVRAENSASERIRFGISADLADFVGTMYDAGKAWMDFNPDDIFTLMHLGSYDIEIGTAALTRLKVNSDGGINLVPQSAAPAGAAGHVYYDSDDDALFAHDGTSYVNLMGAKLWAESGIDIYNTNSGNVGIGTSSPEDELTIRNGIARIDAGSGSSDRIELDGSASGRPEILMFDSGVLDMRLRTGSTTVAGKGGNGFFIAPGAINDIKFTNSGIAVDGYAYLTTELGFFKSGVHDIKIDANTNNYLQIYKVGSTHALRVDVANANISVGKSSNPSYTLDVASGGVRIDGQSAAPTGAAGVIYYDSDDDWFYGHDGTTFELFAKNSDIPGVTLQDVEDGSNIVINADNTGSLVYQNMTAHGIQHESSTGHYRTDVYQTADGTRGSQFYIQSYESPLANGTWTATQRIEVDSNHIWLLPDNFGGRDSEIRIQGTVGGGSSHYTLETNRPDDDNSVQVVDSDGSSRWSAIQYASMRVSGGSTTVSAGTDERIDNDTPGTTTTLKNIGNWTIASSGISYTGTDTVDVEVIVSLSSYANSAADMIYELAKEGTVLADTEMERDHGGTDNGSISLIWIGELVTNDTLEVFVDHSGAGNETINSNNLIMNVKVLNY